MHDKLLGILAMYVMMPGRRRCTQVRGLGPGKGGTIVYRQGNEVEK